MCKAVHKESNMAKLPTKPAFAAPSPGVAEAIDAEEKAAALRTACYSYEQKRADLQAKFEAALSALREQYLAECLAIHTGEESAQ
jgi:hypothetical protein